MQATFLRGTSALSSKKAGNPSLAAELEELDNDRLDTRCRRNGLSKKGGREMQVLTVTMSAFAVLPLHPLLLCASVHQGRSSQQSHNAGVWKVSSAQTAPNTRAQHLNCQQQKQRCRTYQEVQPYMTSGKRFMEKPCMCFILSSGCNASPSRLQCNFCWQQYRIGGIWCMSHGCSPLPSSICIRLAVSRRLAIQLPYRTYLCLWVCPSRIFSLA